MTTTKLKDVKFPPANISEMRSIMLKVEQGEIDLPMGRKSRQALTLLLDNPRIASMHSISDLADNLKISAATLTRLSRLLGFSSFKLFQRVFRSEMMGTSEYYSRQIKSRKGQVDDIRQLFSDARVNLDQLEKDFDFTALEAVCKQLQQAQRVHCFGYRQTFSLSSFLCYGLGMIRQGVQLLNASGQGLAYALGQISKQDVLVGFSFHPYSSRTVKMLQLANKMSIPMIVITDSMGSPIAKLGKQVLLVPVTSGFYSNSMVSACLLIEIILSRLAQRMGNKSLEQLEQRESLISQLNDEY